MTLEKNKDKDYEIKTKCKKRAQNSENKLFDEETRRNQFVCEITLIEYGSSMFRPIWKLQAKIPKIYTE